MVLLALVMAMPLIVRLVFWAATLWVRFCVPPGTFVNKLLSAASPATEMFMLDAAPVAFDVSTRRYGLPLPSLMMVAPTPRLALLIALAIPCKRIVRTIDGNASATNRTALREGRVIEGPSSESSRSGRAARHRDCGRRSQCHAAHIRLHRAGTIQSTAGDAAGWRWCWHWSRFGWPSGWCRPLS